MLTGDEVVTGGPAAPVPGSKAAGLRGEDLTEGLMLLRATAMKTVRLQLAIERRDRRLALEALDDLVRLDGRIGDLLGAFPPDAADPSMAQQLEQERGALVRERLTLAADMHGPRLSRSEPRWIEPEPALEAVEPAPGAAADEVDPVGSASPKWLAAVLFLAAMAPGGAALFGTAAGHELIATLSSLNGGLQ